MAAGGLDANGIYQYGEDDLVAAPDFSSFLNLGQQSVSDRMTLSVPTYNDLPAGIYPGQAAWVINEKSLYVWSGSRWVGKLAGETPVTGISFTGSAPVYYSGNVTVPFGRTYSTPPKLVSFELAASARLAIAQLKSVSTTDLTFAILQFHNATVADYTLLWAVEG